MPLRPVPVTLGSPEFHTASVPGCSVVHAWFPPGLTIEPHTHEHACFMVMLNGSFDLRFNSRSFACTPASIAVEPAGERHSNDVSSEGADVLVLQPDPAHTELWRAFRPLFERIGYLRHGGIASIASRLAHEMGSPDSFSPLAIEALMLEMLVAAARIYPSGRGSDAAPPWLVRAQEILHEESLAKLRASTVADAVGVHPAHLARAFRRHYRVSLGTYVRRLRLDWAAQRLAGSDDPIAAIALQAGFADQSHLTRSFKRYLAVTPEKFRRRHRPSGGKAVPPTPSGL